MYKFLSIATTLVAASTLAHAQNQRRAEMTGGGYGNTGKCTVEVMVDGAAEVEIQGENATLRDLSGQPPQFRRFQCTGPMPANPTNFRFSGVDGRGRQQLVRDPRNGGAAVIRIEDPEGGAEAYTFDLTWDPGGPSTGNRYPGDQNRGTRDPVGRSYPAGSPPVPAYPGTSTQDRGQYPGEQHPARRSEYPGDQSPAIRSQYPTDQYPATRSQYPGEPDRNRQPEYARPERPPQDRFEERDREATRQLSSDQAIGACQDAIRDKAARNNMRDIEFRRVGFDDNPARRNLVAGTFAVRRGYSGIRIVRFSCSVDFESGRIRSADIQPLSGR